LSSIFTHPSAARDAGQSNQIKTTTTMKTTLNTSDIASALESDENANWSWNGAKALAEYLEEYEESTGRELELDVCAIRCDFSEHSSLEDWAVDYFSDSKQASSAMGLELDMDGETWTGDEEEIQDAIRSYIQDHGTLIEFDGGVIVSSF
jgi:hypothetical protein